MKNGILREINSPDDLKKLDYSQLDGLCREIRGTIIDAVSKNGGHLASSLGAVELTVALHRSFNAPDDAIIFDVGHQSYTHKILTGRFEKFATLRKKDGLSGFMCPDESIYDAFTTGHAGNSISAAYGIYKANSARGINATAVAVIGDGAMTCGMAYEALNNAGGKKGNFIIVLNDNKMSISKNVGAVSRSFMRMRNGSSYHRLKFAVGNGLLKLGFIGRGIYRIIYKIKDALKGIVLRHNVFAALGFNYLGPIDGHNIFAMESMFKIAQKYDRPTVVHVVTKKGKGYAPAEENPNDYHGVAPFNTETGVQNTGKIDFSAVAGKTLCRLAESNNRICAITAAMTYGTGLTGFSKKYRDRFFDVGIAEEHAVTFAAGLAKGGMVPFFAVYSSFLQRSYDQVLHDAAIAKLPVKLLVDRAGIVGEDGKTHQGVFDIAFLTTVPGINVYSPYSFAELEYRIEKTSQDNELAVIRYPRGGEGCTADFDISGDYTLIGGGKKVLVVTFGRITSNAIKAREELNNFDILKLNKIFPIESDAFDLMTGYNSIHIFEEGIRAGSIGEHIASRLIERGAQCDIKIHAIDGAFVPQQTVDEALREFGLDVDSIIAATEDADEQ